MDKKRIGVIVGGVVLLVALISYVALPTEKRLALDGKLGALAKEYCAERNHAKRELLISVIRDEFPEYPAEGICGRLEK